MRWMVWNIRGVNKAYKRKELRNIISKLNVSLVILLETRVKEHKAKPIIEQLPNDFEWNHNYDYASNGRIWLLWKKSLMSIQIVKVMDQLIHATVTLTNGKSIMLSTIYGSNNAQTSSKCWHELINLGYSGTPWILCGDWNATLNVTDRVHFENTFTGDNELFQVTQTLHLMEMSTKGGKFTWCNRQAVDHRVYSKIDRVFCNFEWVMNFLDFFCECHEVTIYDHKLLTINFARPAMARIKPFHFINTWAHHDEFKTFITENWTCWHHGSAITSLISNLKSLKQKLRRKFWSGQGDESVKIKEELNTIQLWLHGQLFDSDLISKERDLLSSITRPLRIVMLSFDKDLENHG